MNTLNEKISHDLKEAMKSKDTVSMSTLRALKSALKYGAIEKLGAEGELPEGEALAVVRKQIKQRKDSFEQFTNGGRADLAEKETAEIAVLERYLPAAMSEADMAALVDAVVAELGATSKKQMGEVMKVLQERAAGSADGKVLSQLVGRKLN